MKKFIYAAVGLLVTILLIYIGFNIFGQSKKIADSVYATQGDLLTDLQEYDIVKYEDYDISGSVAISYIKSMVADYKLSVTVIEVSGSFVIDDSADFKNLRDVTSSEYINPYKIFRCSISRDENEVITGVTLEVNP